MSTVTTNSPFARARGASWLRVLSTGHAFSVCRAGYQDRSRPRKNCGSPYSRDFVAFLEEVMSLCPPRQQIHIILDNLSAHKTQLVPDFLQRHPRVQFHFTPTYSSWLNQVELWFAKIEREVIARASLLRCPIWLANPAATSTLTRPTLARSNGNTRTLHAAYVLTNSLRQSTRDAAPGIVIAADDTKKNLDSDPKHLPDHVLFKITDWTYSIETKRTYPFRHIGK